MYSSIEKFKDFRDVVYVEDDSLKIARKFLEEKKYRMVEIERHYDIEGCIIVDLNLLGLRVCYDDESKFSSLAGKLFPKSNASRA